MKFYYEIQTLNNQELKKRVKEKIEEQEKIAKEENKSIHTIGYKLDYNPTDYHLLEKEQIKSFTTDIQCFYSGYIPKGMRIVYGMGYDENGIVSNDGRYYYIDEDDYILGFCNYIKDIEIINEYELFDCILEFLRAYFGYIKQINREEMYQMIQKSDRIYYKPQKEHCLSWFKRRGNAMCSEYAILAQNILCIFGIDSYLVIGREKTGMEKGESHAFNLISFEEENKEERKALIDFANFVEVVNEKFQKIGESPYMMDLDTLDEQLVKELVQEERHLIGEDYSYMVLGDKLIKIGYNRDRDYCIGNQIIPDETLQKEKTMI